MTKKIIATTVVATSLLNALDMPPMPPMMPTKHIEKKATNTTPKSCELIPPMVIFLPPPMEKELIKCKNEMNKPKKDFVQKQLSKLFKKKVIVNKIEIVKKFNQLYKITYNGGVILTNQNVDGFIKQ